MVEGKEAVRWREKEMDHGVELSRMRYEKSKTGISFFSFAQNVNLTVTCDWQMELFQYAHENETLPFESSTNNEQLHWVWDGPKPIYM